MQIKKKEKEKKRKKRKRKKKKKFFEKLSCAENLQFFSFKR